MSAALQNIMRSVQQKLLNISKVDGQPSAVVLSRWPRGVADVDGRRSGGKHHTGGKQRAWTDDVLRSAAGAGEGRGDSTMRGLRGARVQAGRADGQAGRHASRRPESSQNGLVNFIVQSNGLMQ